MYIFSGEKDGEYLHRIPEGDAQILRPAGNASGAFLLPDNVTKSKWFKHRDATSISLYCAQLSSSTWGF